MSLSIIICTRNRVDSLCCVLDALAGANLSRSCEVVVVDNASVDDTALLVKKRAGEHSFLRYVYHGKEGLSHARNEGIKQARGEIVAFLDDDAVPGPGWAEALVAAFEDEDVSAVGGRCVLQWPEQKPHWFPEEFERYLAPYDRGNSRMWVIDDHLPVGANMAFRRSLFEELGGFDTRLGYSGKSKLGWEDIEMFSRVRSKGGRVLYEPAAVVDHLVGHDKISKAYIRKRLLAEGFSHVFFAYLIRHPRKAEIYRDLGSAMVSVLEAGVFHVRWLARHGSFEFKYLMDSRRRIGRLFALLLWAVRASVRTGAAWEAMREQSGTYRPSVAREVSTL